MKFLQWSSYFFISLLVFSNHLWALSIEERTEVEIDNFLAELVSENLTDVARTAQMIAASGVESEELYNLVETRALEYHYKQIEAHRDDALATAEEALLRALGASGNPVYRDTLELILGESPARGSRNRAKNALDKMSWYARRNDIMRDMSAYRAEQSLMTIRYLNLLEDASQNINRYALEELYRIGEADEEVTDWIANNFFENLHQDKGPLYIDLMAWHCRAIIKLARDQYAERIRALNSDKAIDSKIRRHCRTELKR